MGKMDIKRWRSLWERLGADADMDSVYSALVEKYSEKHRAYHNVKHLEQCLEEFDGVKGLLNRPDEVEMAIWFHDAIYKPTSSKNEAESARWAAAEMKKAGASDDSIRVVNDLILATKHDGAPDSGDAEFLIDIDLSILGSAPEIYREYEENIRKEYKWVPPFIFRKKRKEILNSFLKRDRIYATEFFRKKYEQNARANLKSEA